MKFIAARPVLEEVIETWAHAAGYPFPHREEKGDAAAKRDAWLAANPAQRAALLASGAYYGWTLFPAEVQREPGNGTRTWLEAPDDLHEIVAPMAATHFGRSLSARQNQVLQQSKGNMSDAFPGDWGQDVAQSAGNENKEK